MPNNHQTRLLSSSDSEVTELTSDGVTFDPDQQSELSYRTYHPRHAIANQGRTELNQTVSAPAIQPREERPKGKNRESGQAEAAVSDYSDFQQSSESGSDSFQADSYYPRDDLAYRIDRTKKDAGTIVKKAVKKTLQREFEDLLRRYRTAHLMKIHQTYIRLKKTGALCDIVLKTAETQIPVHSAVVVAHSGLCEKEARDFHSTSTFPIIVTLSNDLQTRAVLLVVDFMYMAKLEIELTTLVSILNVAKELEVYVIAARCNKIMERLLEDQNIVQTIQAATELGVEDLQRIAWSKFTKDFKAFCSRSSFQEQSLNTVVKILSSDHLIVKSEFEVFEAAMSWINHKRAERLKHLARLMDCVRLVYMTDEELVSCMQYDPSFGVSPGLEILAQANMNKMLKDRGELAPDYALPRVRTSGSKVTNAYEPKEDQLDRRQRASKATLKQTNSLPTVPHSEQNLRSQM
ncbi:hypothetical protein RvY_14626 [Ramazzottius varieornatus]|uniref:BTB domain-containing protein n=1 Tax=Ramazzottius varieornatus TaxID=947166 RepID=A0A1D1W0D6_RAMVA|nr:hypothetical protein RvY_14626 [Ramazzottius varieornatus]